MCVYDLVPQSMYGCFPEVGLHLVLGSFRKASPPMGERHLDSFRASSSSDEARATIETDLGFWLFKSMQYILFKHVFWPKILSESVKRLFSREQCKQASSPQSKHQHEMVYEGRQANTKLMKRTFDGRESASHALPVIMYYVRTCVPCVGTHGSIQFHPEKTEG